jgi:hypothetical protein
MKTSKLINLNNKTMKNLILITAFVFGIQTTVFSQNKINTDDLIGYWKPNEESSQLFFWKDIEGNLQIQEICGSTGEPIDLISLKIKDDCIIARTIFIPNHWVTESSFKFKDKKTLVCHITGNAETIITYTKIK